MPGANSKNKQKTPSTGLRHPSRKVPESDARSVPGDGSAAGADREERGRQRTCNVQLADDIMLISIISLIVIFAHAPVLSNLIYTKTCAVTLTGKRQPNHDPEL